MRITGGLDFCGSRGRGSIGRRNGDTGAGSVEGVSAALNGDGGKAQRFGGCGVQAVF